MRPLLLVFALSCLAFGVARATVVVGLDQEWSWSPAQPSSHSPLWLEPGFNDSSWNRGRSGFGTLAYGEQTPIPAFDNTRTVLFRKTFPVSNPELLGTLLLRIDFRDGFVAHLNGREVARRGFSIPPTSPVAIDAIPLSRPAGAAEDIRLGPASALLMPGTNVLAIQVHSAVAWQGIVLVPELLADFIRGPYLQASDPHAMTILWHSADSAPARLRHGPDHPPTNVIDLPVGQRHEVTLPNLVPGQIHHYAVSTFTPDGREIRGPVHSFRALPDRGRARISVLGDSGAGTAAQWSIARTLAREPADLVLHAGDVIYPAFTDALADVRLLSVYREHMARVPFVFAWGNHDLPHGTGPMRSVMRTPPTDTPAETHLAEETTPQSYYSLDIGEAHIAVLYQPAMSQYALRPQSAQLKWLESDLSSSTKPWKFLIAHHPIQTSGGHRFTDYNANGIPDWIELSEVLLPVIRRHGVQLYLSGHDHIYERFLPQDGLHSLITGGGGAPLYGLRAYDFLSSQMHVQHHFIRLTVDRHQAHVQAVNAQGHVFDSFSLHQAPPAAPPFHAAWIPITPETRTANNTDGNITGQTYPLDPATPIPAVTGRTANLGQLRVALDPAHLHIGLDRLIFGPETDACVFIELPDQSGIATLAGLGNGIPDPAGEGVDALDGMENLSFLRFRPSIAAVVGDELADATDRSFKRPGHSQGLGQGVFHLIPGFPNLPGAYLQQFNRSPQDNIAPPEQNADFIVISLPRSELGPLKSGDFLRIGVIAAGRPDPVRQLRALDSGFIGRSFSIDDAGIGLLEGIAIRVPGDPSIELEILAQHTSDGSIQVAWPVIPGLHDLQESPTLDGPWRSVPGFPKSIETVQASESLPANDSTRFLRVRRLP